VLLAERQLVLAEPALAAPDVHALAEEALETLARWDHVLGAGSTAAAIYQLTHFFATRRILEPWLGELTEPAMGVGFHPLLNPILFSYMDRTPLVITELLTADEADWWKGLRRETVLARALYDALHYLRTTLGPSLPAWSWGAVHYAGFHHPLGQQKPLDRIFDRGPFPYGGDTNTVWQAAFVPKLPIRPEGGFTASWRQILDVGNWDASIGVHTTGQSGHPASPHYDDMIPMWLSGEYHPLLWTRERIEAHLEARLTLEPG
jgi:penicillin amidase